MVAAGAGYNKTGRKKKTANQARNVTLHSMLLPRERICCDFAGRSPDLRFSGSICLPIPRGTVDCCDRTSTLTVAGPCWIFTSFPCTSENFDLRI